MAHTPVHHHHAICDRCVKRCFHIGTFQIQARHDFRRFGRFDIGRRLFSSGDGLIEFTPGGDGAFI